MLAGAVLPFLIRPITRLGTSTLLIGATFAAYFLNEALFGKRLPGLLVAMVVGIVVAVTSGASGPIPDPVWPQVTLTAPDFTVRALLTATPVMVVFITLQANAPSIVFLRSQNYEAPERFTSIVSGVGTMIGSFFGPMGVSLSLPATALTAGPDAGDHDVRHWAVYIAGVSGVLIALAAGFAADLVEFIPQALLNAVVGLAVLGILVRSLGEITKGPLVLGPVVAFAVSVTGDRLVLLDLGSPFWAIVFGLAVSFLLEKDKWFAGQATKKPAPAAAARRWSWLLNPNLHKMCARWL
ncbi:MAG TPA: benzoate/H(+) symporter BenE family transporter [Acidimicrobiia bacterium]|nr:benzoate/H(+) symporter BenE family transporter [Acidimicrobiia bacterium]